MQKTPTTDDLNRKLNSIEWENLCNGICVEEFLTNRVNDSNGKGNGMDAYKILDNESVAGYQFKKYKEGFGSKQVKTLQDNIKLAYNTCMIDFERSLVKYVVIFNINLDPSHMGAEGELKRFEEKIIKWAKGNFNIKVEYFGMDWVHNKLLKHSFL
ncbi:hypothetical protein AB4Z22_26995, partial [Paenibacillus sp. TAF58]